MSHHVASSPSCEADPHETADCRCMCGSLLARWVEGAVELKCRRCKRTLRVPLSQEGAVDRPHPVRVIPVGEAG